MKKKLISFLLVVSLLFTLPFGVMAESKISLSVALGSEFASEQGLSELVDAFDLQLYLLDPDSLLTKIAVAGNELVFLEVSVDEQGLFLTSNLVEEKTYFVSWEYLETLLASALAKAKAEMLNASNPTESIKNLFINPSSGMSTTAPQTVEEYLAQSEAVNPEYAAWLKEIFDRAVIETGVFELEDMDQADTKTVIHLTTEDMKAYLELDYRKEMLTKAYRSANPNATEADIQAQLDESIATATSGPIDLTMAVYSIKNDFTGLEIVGDIENKDLKETLNADGKIVRSSHDGITDYVGTVNLRTPDDKGLQEKVEFSIKDQQLLSGSFAILFDQTEVTIIVNTEDKDDGNSIICNAYVRENAVNIIDPAPSASPFMTITLANEDLKEKVELHLDKTDAVDLSQYTQDDYDQLMTVFQGNLLGIFLTLLTSIPSESLGTVSSMLGV